MEPSERRQYYLQAMAIDSYVPRLFLPGAPETQRYYSPADDQPVVAEKPPQATCQSLSTQTKKAIVLPTKHSITQQSVIQSIPVKFSLAVVALPQQLLLVDDCLPLLSKSPNYRQLLQNILFALGFGQCDIYVQLFQWPMVSVVHNDQVDDQTTVASEALQAYLLRQVQQHAVPKLLLMGDTAARYVDSSGDNVSNAALSLPTIVTLSASRMLTEPQYKCQLWQQLQPFRRRKT